MKTTNHLKNDHIQVLLSFEHSNSVKIKPGDTEPLIDGALTLQMFPFHSATFRYPLTDT